MAVGQFVKSPFTFINANIAATGTTPAPVLSLLLISKRGTINANTLGELDIPLYQPFVIPSENTGSGQDVLNYLRSLGATINLGISNSINLVAPEDVNIVGSTVQLIWDEEPVGWQDLLAGSITGSVTQGAATGTILTVSQSSFMLTLGNITGTFATSGVVTINYVNQSIAIPDGKQTETFALDLYYAVEAMNLTNTLNLTFGKPSISISIVSDRDSPYNPNAAPVTLGVPDDVVDNGDGTVSIFYDTAPANWIYVPQTTLGTSGVSQATSLATGTIVQQLSAQYTPTGSGVGLLLTDVEDDFNTTNIVSLILDNTVSIFSLLGTNYYKFVQQTYAILNNTAFNTTYAQFRDYINSVNSEDASSNGLLGTFGVIAVSSVPYASYLTTAQPNSNNFIYANYYYPNRIGDIYISAGQVAASLAGALSCNLPPFNPMDGIALNGLPVSSDTSTYLNTLVPTGQGEALLQYGQTPIGVSSTTGQAYIVNPVTTQITIPNSGVIDQEFYDVGTWQVVNEIKYRLDTAVKAPIFLNSRLTPKTLINLSNAVYNALKEAESENMIFNVDALKPFTTVVLNPADPHGVIINCEIQVAPAYTGTTININLISALITPNTTQA